VLGGTGDPYSAIYEAMDNAVATAHLAHVLDEDLQAQCEEKARRITADQIVSCLRQLKGRAPGAYSNAQFDLPKDVHALDPERITFRRFHVHADKRQGKAAFSATEKRRIARRRTEERIAGVGNSATDP
jgi:hypothetical protein